MLATPIVRAFETSRRREILTFIRRHATARRRNSGEKNSVRRAPSCWQTRVPGPDPIPRTSKGFLDDDETADGICSGPSAASTTTDVQEFWREAAGRPVERAEYRPRRAAEKLYRLGPRPLAELLLELARERLLFTVIEEKLRRYTERLSPAALAACSGDSLPPTSIQLVMTGRTQSTPRLGGRCHDRRIW
jgi:hypothetical protein